MRKQNILLTIWLALPITIVSLLMVWIFVSLDKDRLMDDAVPVGAGAGDTGNANALGQWLAGRDANAISEALEARRAGRAIDPRDWPGGVRIEVGINDWDPETRLTMTLIHDEQGRYTSSNVKREDDGTYLIAFDQYDLKGSFFVLCESLPTRVPTGFKDESGNALKIMILEPQVPDPDLQVSDPMMIRFELDTVFEQVP